MLYASLYPVLRTSLDAGIYIVGGLAFGPSFVSVHLVAAVPLFGLAVVAFSSVGVLSAAFTLVLKHGDPVVWLFFARCRGCSVACSSRSTCCRRGCCKRRCCCRSHTR